MLEKYISPDTQATLLLCGSLGQKRNLDPQPLTITEYNKLAKWLLDSQMRPADLLSPEGVETLDQLNDQKLDTNRVKKLLIRGGSLGFSVELWSNKGLWVIGRSDEAYPEILKTRLKSKAPPILYGAGPKENLNKGGLAIVGSRNVDDDGLYFSCRSAVNCAKQSIQVISGGARGVDQEAMTAALDEGGFVLAVLSNGLLQKTGSKKYRDAIRENRLTLISPFDPEAGFNVGNAMGRNKIIYALSDWSLVVDATPNKGGTWAGATENLKHQWVPLFIRNGSDAPKGNIQLLSLGGLEFSQEQTNQSELKKWLDIQRDIWKTNQEPKSTQLSFLN